MQRVAEDGSVEWLGQRIVITDDDIEWELFSGLLSRCFELAISKGLYYVYGNNCIFDLHDLGHNFREMPEEGEAYVYDYVIWEKGKGWLHPAFDYRGSRLEEITCG